MSFAVLPSLQFHHGNCISSYLFSHLRIVQSDFTQGFFFVGLSLVVSLVIFLLSFLLYRDSLSGHHLYVTYFLNFFPKILHGIQFYFICVCFFYLAILFFILVLTLMDAEICLLCIVVCAYWLFNKKISFVHFFALVQCLR